MACRDKAMLRWCDALKKYNFIIQHCSDVKHQNADTLSRMRLTKCGWAECPDCKGGFTPFAHEDGSILTKHDEELIIKPIPAPQKGDAVKGQKAISKVMSLRTEKAQASVAGETHQSACIRQKRIDAVLLQPAPAQTPSLPQLTDRGTNLSQK